MFLQNQKNQIKKKIGACTIVFQDIFLLINLVKIMVALQKYVFFILNFIISIIGYIPAALYAYVYSQFFTKVTYRQIGQRNKNRKKVKNVLDVGTATGGPLHSIIDSFSQAKVLGIDYNKLYIPACKKLFKAYPNVEIKHMNFYDLQTEQAETQFDIIIFGSSFMIMPDQAKAIEVAKRKLSHQGHIYFLLTLYEEKTFANRVMELIKPLLKYICTIDFGKVTYRKDFETFLNQNKLKPTLNERCFGNFFLKMAKFYIYEVETL